jgi:hypothetical protein
MSESFSNAQLDSLTRPCVYQFMKDGKPLYIGSSANGLLRFAGNGHHKASVRRRADEIRVIWMSTESEARELEKRLIGELRPPCNGRGTRELRALPPRLRREKRTGCVFKPQHCRYWYIRYRLDDGKLSQESSRSESKEVAEQLLADRMKRSPTTETGVTL